jgi:hypothetical protein
MTKSEFRAKFQCSNRIIKNCKIVNYFIILAWSLIVLSQPLCAQNKDVIINADRVSYDEKKNLVEASGSVEVFYKDISVFGKHIFFNTASDEVMADQGFTLSYSNINITGSTLNYQIDERKGTASDVCFSYDSIRLTGKSIDLSEDVLKLRNAAFTTCDLPDPHYRVTASNINFYPKYGWLVAYWGYFWLGPFPVVPMPTYIYDMHAKEKQRENIPPFPEVGSNDVDGTYINETLAWNIRRELSGSYSLIYATKKGLGGGVEADYIVNENSRGNARLYGIAKDGFWAGITHHIFFGQELPREREETLRFFQLPKMRRYEFISTLSYRERINYERVSLYPNLDLKSRQGKTFWPQVEYDSEIMLGAVAEENNIALTRSGGNIKFNWDLPKASIGEITPSLGLDTLYYSNGQNWTKTTGEIDLKKSLAENVELGIGYLHYFTVDGQSPFNFEMYRFSSSDRLRASLLFYIGETGINLSASYFLDTWSPEDIDYSLLFKMHCYNLMVKYRSIRREFELGFSLAAGG